MKEIALLSSILSYSTTQAQYDNDDEDFEGSGSGDFAPPIYDEKRSQETTKNIGNDAPMASDTNYSVVMYAGIAAAALFIVVGVVAFVRHRKKDENEYSKGDAA